MAEIARVSQVLVGQIYRDFARKEDLIAAIVERDVTQILDDPDIAGSIATGNVDQLNNWVRRFMGERLEQEARNILADILAEAGRNPRIAAIVSAAHKRFHDRVASAAALWVPAPEKEAARHEIAELILATAGAIRHRQLFGLESDALITKKMLDVVYDEIARLGPTA